MFNEFISFDNSGDSLIKEESITDIYQSTKLFLDSNLINEAASEWLNRNSINRNISNMFKESKNVKANSKSIQKTNIKAKGCGKHMLADNACPSCELVRIAGKQDDVRYGDTKANPGGYTFRTYEEKGPTLKINPPAKEPNFQKDNDKNKKLKRGDKSVSAFRVGKPDGIGAEWNTRTNGSGLTGGAGLGNPMSSESVEYSNANPASTAMPSGGSVNPLSGSFSEKKVFSKFRVKKEAIDSPGEVAMGVGGTLGGSGNKEGMATYGDERRIGISIKKKINRS